jgi:hypothetical protein
MSITIDQGAEQWGAPRSKTVIWYGPASLGASVAKLTGREFMQAISDGRLPPPPMASLRSPEVVLRKLG